jgi:lysophospholipase L1-like esterase
VGIYAGRTASARWDTLTLPIVSPMPESLATVQIDLGAHAAAVEVAGVRLRRRGDSLPVPLVATEQYLLRYRFNARGCRGPEYAVPRPVNTVRILALGDSYALGAGVRFGDTWEERLAAVLAQRDSSRRWEVVNCGVSGYGTHEARLFWTLFGSAYTPQLVVVTMVMNDDRSFLEDVRLGYVPRPTLWTELFQVWRLADHLLHRRPTPDFHPAVDELKQLDSAVRAAGARLVVMIYRNAPAEEPRWRLLTETVTAALAGSGIPLLDLGPPLFKAVPNLADLFVHPTLDAHPSALANRIAADTLAAFLAREGLLPPP